MSREGVSDSRPSKRSLSFGGRTFSFREIEMNYLDFHHHYTPPELMRTSQDGSTVLLDENGNPNYRFNELADLAAHVRMMDRAGIDIAVLSCGEGFDQPNLGILCALSILRRQHGRHLASTFDEVLHHRTKRSILEREYCNWPGTNTKIDRQHFEREPVNVESEH